MSPFKPSAGFCAQLACVWEVTARKPGNVHRFCDFDDVGYLDFVHSAAAIAPVLDSALEKRLGVGQIVLDGIRATRNVTSTNTNLGILLLIAPLAKAVESDLRSGVEAVLSALTVDDACAVYEAIRLACPGGMGKVPEQDVSSEPTRTLREVMALARDRDLIAREYANGFHAIFSEGVPALEDGIRKTGSLEGAIIHCQLRLLAGHPDTLIARKLNHREATGVSRRARHVLEAGWPESAAGRSALFQLDRWLRAEGHARNPGTTADLVTACLFILLREGRMKLPLEIPFATEHLYD